MARMNLLMLCAGDARREGWRTLDARGGDFIAKIPPLPASVKLIAWDEIEWIHGVGSFYPWDAAALLEELRNCLAPDGRLSLEQPDWRKAVSRVEWLFGDPSLKEPLIMNRWAYTPESLAAAVHAAGFSRVEILPAQHHVPARDFRVEAYI